MIDSRFVGLVLGVILGICLSWAWLRIRRSRAKASAAPPPTWEPIDYHIIGPDGTKIPLRGSSSRGASYRRRPAPDPGEYE
jgi:hypothetical protein